MVVGGPPQNWGGGLKAEAFTETGRDTGTGSGVGRCFKKNTKYNAGMSKQTAVRADRCCGTCENLGWGRDPKVVLNYKAPRRDL